MREYDRTILLERVDRDGSTVGVRMPMTVEVGGETVAVREPVLELTGTDELSDSQRERAAALARTLRAARTERYQQLKGDDLDREAGERLADTIAGLDRALNALAQLDAPGVAEQAEQRSRVDQQRWLSFLKETLGHDTERTRR